MLPSARAAPSAGAAPSARAAPSGAAPSARAADCLLELRGVSKAFPGVLAIKNADFDVRAGEIHALVGENGAGKSTLIKVVTGAHPPDRGCIRLQGEEARLSNPFDALRRGVAAIYQEFTLVPGLTVRENLFLGRERARLGWPDRAHERDRTRGIFQQLDAAIDPECRAGDLTVAQQQLVETARALLADARLLIMDEPTAALAPREVERLFDVLRRLKAQGRGIVFISHRLDEVLRIADRVTVMRDGETVGTLPTADLTRDRLIERMVGHLLEREFPKETADLGRHVLTVERLRGGKVREASFHVREGEVLGLAGLVGAGRTELVRLLFGADRLESGTIRLFDEPVRIMTPRDAIGRGIGLLTEDRKGQGLVLGLSALENFALPNLAHWSRRGWIDRRPEQAAFERFVANLRIRVAGPGQPAGHLSGGNQQKLLVARWLEHDARVLIFDEPTRGIDVGAKHEMYLLINKLAARGKAVVMISSEMEEILGMSDRILVMHEGRIRGELDARDPARCAAITAEEVMKLAIG
jgi:ribose transport system ATP-binding protein